MTFKDLLPASVCGTCGERPRPTFVQLQHGDWWDLILGCYVECPDCGNVFEPGTWDSSGEKAKYVKTDHPTEPVGIAVSPSKQIAGTE